MNTPKIIILQLKDIIYTALFAILGIILIIVLIYMFMPGKSGDTEPTIQYDPGIYTSSISLEDQVVSVEVTIYDNEIKNINFKDLNPVLALRYALLEETMAEIKTQVDKKGDIQKVVYRDDTEETTKYIMSVIDKALSKAIVSE